MSTSKGKDVPSLGQLQVMSKKDKKKMNAQSTAPLVSSTSTLVLSRIEEVDDPENAIMNEATVEQRVRLAWEHFRVYEIELARQRKSEARRNAAKHGGSGLPPTSKRGKSSGYIAAKVGMKQTSFQVAALVVELADQLKKDGRSQDAARLLHLLNNVSVNSAKRERQKLIQLMQDEEAIQRDLTQSLQNEME